MFIYLLTHLLLLVSDVALHWLHWLSMVQRIQYTLCGAWIVHFRSSVYTLHLLLGELMSVRQGGCQVHGATPASVCDSGMRGSK